MRATTLSVALLALCACTPRADQQAAPPAQAEAATPGETGLPAGHAFQDAIDAGDFAEHVRHLASDEFAGRGPGTQGEDKTVDYIKAQFERIGLKPGNADSFFQTVPMTETTADESTALRIDANGKEIDRLKRTGADRLRRG